MCGIVGIISKSESMHINSHELYTMCRMQKHRGPDDEGCVALSMDATKIMDMADGEHVSCKCLLGFERLSIQDVSLKGHQPMVDAERKVSIIFNGEIYNFIELRKKLEQRGRVLESSTDTEVLLNMYLEYGIEQTLSEINGMFAFVIADLREKKIYIARDRFGIKPLYIANTTDAVLVSSEMKSFLPYHAFHREINMSALEEYAVFKGLLTDTLFKDVQQVEPGSVLSYDLETNQIKKSKYFDIESLSRSDNELSLSDCKDYFWEVFRSTVKRQTISDVKVGCQLSGGIDSSILALTVAKEHGLYDTVSCKVDSSHQIDAPYIDLVNKKLNANAHIGVVNADYFIKNLLDVVWHFESILSHTPSIGMYQISQQADDNKIKVLLSGEGADELFGGYGCFTKLAFAEEHTDSQITNQIIFRDGKEDDELLRKIIPNINTEPMYSQRINLLNHFTGSNFDRQSKYEMSTQLSDLLYRQDKMSMAHSVENRVPFLDNEIIKFAWNIPERMLIDADKQEGKYVLKEIVADLFGKEFAYRRKVGFFIPGNMFMSSNMPFVRGVLANCRKRGIIACDMLDEWAENSLSSIGGLNHFNSALFFKMFTFEIWCQLYLDGLSLEQCKLMINAS